MNEVEVIKHYLQYQFESTKSSAANVPEAARLKQLAPAKAHPLWIMGHLSSSLDTVMNLWTLDGGYSVPKEYNKIFTPDTFGGDPVVTDADKYPGWDDVVAQYSVTTDKALSLLDALDASTLDEVSPNVPEPMRDFFKTRRHTIMHMVTHDSYHRGQMNLIAALPE